MNLKLKHFLEHYALVSLELVLILALVDMLYGGAFHEWRLDYRLLTGFILPAYAAFYIITASGLLILAIANARTEETAMRFAIARAKSGKTEPFIVQNSPAFNFLTHLDTIVLVAACWKADLRYVATGIGISFLICKPAEYFNLLCLRRAEETIAAIRKGLSVKENEESSAACNITRIGKCIIVHGHFPIEMLLDLQKETTDDAVMDLHVARLMDATIAMGPAAELDALACDPDILDAARARSAAALSGVRLPRGALEWHATGYRGASSDAIFHFLLGLRAPGGLRTPSDAADFRRCRVLLERVPDFASDFGRMADASPDWAKLVDRWSELCALMDEECPDWRNGHAPCPATNALLKNIVN